MAINSKNKGNTYERKIVKVFTALLDNHKKKGYVKFERTAASGGLSEQGDIQCVYGKFVGKRFVRNGYVDFPFGIECKHNKQLTLDKFMNDVSNKIVGTILDQVLDESEKLSAAKKNMFIVKLEAQKTKDNTWEELIIKNTKECNYITVDETKLRKRLERVSEKPQEYKILFEAIHIIQPVALIMKVKNVDDLIAFPKYKNGIFKNFLTKYKNSYRMKFKYKHEEWFMFKLNEFLDYDFVRTEIGRAIDLSF